MRRWLVPLALAMCAAGAHAATLLDDFRDASPWSVVASEQVQARLERGPGRSLCLAVNFAGTAGYAVMRRTLPMRWPANFELAATLSGRGATNDVQVKLVDASGDNVWWVNRPNTALPAKPTVWPLRRRHFEFAWGPTEDKSLRETQAIEFVIAAGREGKRTRLCLSKLSFDERAPDPATWPEPVAATRDGVTTIDFGTTREFNGLALRWPAGATRLRYTLSTSADGRWRELRRVRGSDGGSDALFLPEQQARFVRIEHRGNGPAPQLALKTAKEWPNFNAVLASLAREAPPGEMPRAFTGQQNYWTLIGVDRGAERSASLSEDGAVEWGRGGPSLEPALKLADGSRVSWANSEVKQTLREDHLPIAAVTWRHARVMLTIEAGADGPAESPVALVRYRVRNPWVEPTRVTLQLALRPWQVNPPQQFLSTPGGSSPLRTLRWNRTAASLSADRRGALRFTSRPQRVSAATFDGGLPLAALEAAPPLSTLTDAQAHASALLEWPLALAPGETKEIAVALPLAGQPLPPIGEAEVARRLDAAAARWHERLNRVRLVLPPEAQPIADTLRTSLAHMLMSREAAALRPGTRSYARSWIRDGAMMVAGLVRLGERDAAREFVDWYAPYIFASGKVPCCVDAHGAGPVTENDSHGQYLYAVAELLRHGEGDAFARRHWPHVQRVVAWMEGLRQSERTAKNREPSRRHLFGLMPPSISHEGYSDKPAYSLWDNFWALRGYKDAVLLARRAGDEVLAARWAAWRDEYERELAEAIAAAAEHHRVSVIVGAADRGDFDPTSTTMALNPAQAAVPVALLSATFERYAAESAARSEGRRAWKDLTPYELRNVGALVRLGQPEKAHALLDFFFGLQRPQPWRQWAEVVLPDAREPRFLGDMPHAWISSDFIRSALELLVMEDEAANRLVIGAGWKAAWLEHPRLAIEGLSTPWGQLDFSLVRHGGGGSGGSGTGGSGGAGWTLEIPAPMKPAGNGSARPADLVLHWPGSGPLPRASHDGRPLAWQGRELRLPAAPLRVVLTATP